jgi:hypothetical protein
LTIKKVVVPEVAGHELIGPATITCAVDKKALQKRGKGVNNPDGSLYQYPLYFDNSFFDKQVDSSHTVLSASSEPATLEVLPLPTNAPPLFNGLVGRYELNVDLSTNAVRRGDPVVVELQIRSADYFEHVTLPPLQQQPGLTNDFRVADDRRLKQLDGKHIAFTQTVYPRHAGKMPFPSLSLCFFNPTTKAYAVSRSNPIPISVKKARIIDGAFLRSDVADGGALYAWVWIWVAGVVPILIGGAVAWRWHVRLARPLKGKPICFSDVHTQFRETIDLLRKSDFENARDSHAALNAALTTLFAAYLPDSRPGAITYSDIEPLLLSMHQAPSLRHKARVLFEELDRCRFSPAPPIGTYTTTLANAQVLVDGLAG